MTLRLRIPRQDILDAGSDEQARELVRTRLREAGFNLSRHIDCKFDRENDVYAYEHAGIVADGHRGERPRLHHSGGMET